MAMFSKIVLGACAVASIVSAAPVALTITDVVTVTSWVTANETSTIWLPAEMSPAASTTSSSSTTVPVIVFEQTSVSSTYSVPNTTPIVQVEQVVTPSTTPSQTPVASSTFQISTTSAAVGGSFASRAGGSCEGSGAACTGDITHWDGGLGACGWNVNTASDMMIALPVGLMGAQSNGNPYCGRSVTVKDPVSGTTVQATVGDKCMGCTGFAIDLTNVLFTAVTNGKGDGRESGIQWWFN